MNNYLKSPQTVVGSLISLGGVACVIMGKSELGITLIGIGGTWIGVTAKDANKP